MKILDVSELLDAASNLLASNDFNKLEEQVISAVQELAEAIAEHGDVVLYDVSNQPGFGGMRASFYVPAGPDGPPEIGDQDPDGEWQ